MYPFKKYLIILSIFSIAMGFLESAVVVYLRELYYPIGFAFPMASMAGRIALTEILREAATIIMLVTIAMLAGKNSIEKFSWFIFCFALWDIFYYVFLKLLINWPSSLLTWDILFLIPTIWTGPVIAPVIVSLTMFALALLLLTEKIKPAFVNSKWLMLLGTFLMFLSFIWDFAAYMLDQYTLGSMFRPGISQDALSQYIPYRFNWWFFIAGELMVLAGLYLSYRNSKRNQNVV